LLPAALPYPLWFVALLAINSTPSAPPSPTSPSFLLPLWYLTVFKLLIYYYYFFLLLLLQQLGYKSLKLFMVICYWQYSDLAESDRNVILEEFRKATVRWSQIVNAGQSGGGGSGGETGNNDDESNTNNNKTKSHMIVVTDACLPLLALGEAPVSARVLINYELPSKVLFCCSPFIYLFVCLCI
jgi:hypothetical protein